MIDHISKHKLLGALYRNLLNSISFKPFYFKQYFCIYFRECLFFVIEMRFIHNVSINGSIWYHQTSNKLIFELSCKLSKCIRCVNPYNHLIYESNIVFLMNLVSQISKLVGSKWVRVWIDCYTISVSAGTSWLTPGLLWCIHFEYLTMDW